MNRAQALRRLRRLAERAHLHRAALALARLGDRRGDPEATFALGVAHLEGLSGFKRPDLAWPFFERAARAGHAEAQSRCGDFHRVGLGGVPLDLAAARAFYAGAAAQGHPEALRWLFWMRDAAGLEGGPDLEALAARQAPPPPPAPEAPWRRQLREWRREGIGRRGSLWVLGCAGALTLYLALDFWTHGVGPWRPDPARVVWGLWGRVHAQDDGSAARVIPRWARPAVRGVVLQSTRGMRPERTFLGARVALEGLRGKVVYLAVFTGREPLFREAVQEFQRLRDLDPDGAVCIPVYVRKGESTGQQMSLYNEELGLAPYQVEDARVLGPLGSLEALPLNVVLDRRGRIRQRWAGWGPGLAERNLRAALAEAD